MEGTCTARVIRTPIHAVPVQMVCKSYMSISPIYSSNCYKSGTSDLEVALCIAITNDVYARASTGGNMPPSAAATSQFVVNCCSTAEVTVDDKKCKEVTSCATCPVS